MENGMVFWRHVICGNLVLRVFFVGEDHWKI